MSKNPTEDFEKQLKNFPLREPSEKFFEKIENELRSTPEAISSVPEEEILELENRLKNLPSTPPSENFFKKIEEELRAAPEEKSEKRAPEIAFPKKKILSFPRNLSKRISAVAAVCAAVFGILLWKNSLEIVPENSSNEIRSNEKMLQHANAKIDKLFENENAAKPRYELVSDENSLCEVEEMPVEETHDGSLIRKIRYIYTNTKRWRDTETQKTFLEHRPFEEIVPTVLAVY